MKGLRDKGVKGLSPDAGPDRVGAGTRRRRGGEGVRRVSARRGWQGRSTFEGCLLSTRTI